MGADLLIYAAQKPSPTQPSHDSVCMSSTLGRISFKTTNVIYHIIPKTKTAFRYIWRHRYELGIPKSVIDRVKVKEVDANFRAPVMMKRNKYVNGKYVLEDYEVLTRYRTKHFVATISNSLPVIDVYFLVHLFRAITQPQHCGGEYFAENAVALHKRGFTLLHALAIANSFAGKDFAAVPWDHRFIPINMTVRNLNRFQNWRSNINQFGEKHALSHGGKIIHNGNQYFWDERPRNYNFLGENVGKLTEKHIAKCFKLLYNKEIAPAKIQGRKKKESTRDIQKKF